MSERPRRGTLALGLIGTLQLFAAGVLWFWSGWFFLELTGEFRAQSALLALGLALLGLWRGTAATRALLALNLAVQLAFWALPWRSVAALESESALVLGLHNVRIHGGDVDRAVEHLVREGAQVLALLEVSPADLERIDAKLEGFESIHVSRDDPFGAGLWCSLPVLDKRVTHAGRAWIPALEMRVEHAGRAVRIAVTHPPPPLDAAHAEARNEALADLAQQARTSLEPMVVLADLNVTRWARAFRDTLGSGPLDSTAEFRRRPTWPAFAGWLGLPIDHILWSDGFEPSRIAIGPAFGSDHRSVVVALEKR